MRSRCSEEQKLKTEKGTIPKWECGPAGVHSFVFSVNQLNFRLLDRIAGLAGFAGFGHRSVARSAFVSFVAFATATDQTAVLPLRHDATFCSTLVNEQNSSLALLR